MMIKMKKCRNTTAILLWCLLPALGWAQPKYEITLPPVGDDAFYSVDLPYNVLGCARRDLGDIRIRDDKGTEVAWLLREDTESKNSSEFIPLPVEVTATPRHTDVLITGAGEPLSSFVLKIKNADVDKEAELRGSNDGAKWFAVKDRFRLNGTSHPGRTEAMLDLTFPLSDYQYYKLSLNDSLSAPLNVMGVGRMKVESYSKQHLLEVPLTSSHVRTKGKETLLELVLPFNYQFERLDFYISSPRYYRRELRLLQPSGAYSTATLSDTEGCPQLVRMNGYGDTLRLSIANGDDQSLTVDSVKVHVRKYSLVVALKKEARYVMTYGDPRATFPQYDLTFGKQVPDTIARVNISDIKPTEREAEPEEEVSAWLTFFKTYGIWLVIILIIAQILYMVRKMIKKDRGE